MKQKLFLWNGIEDASKILQTITCHDNTSNQTKNSTFLKKIGG